MYDDFFSKAQELLGKDLPFATAIVIRAKAPTSARPGDKAIVTADGVMHGWIGGSCAQPTVIDQAMKALNEGKPRLIRLSPDPQDQVPQEGLTDLPMTCFSGGMLEIHIEPQLPTPRLMIVGNLPVARALAQIGQLMNYRIIVVDPDNDGAGMAGADETISDLSKMAARITSLTYVIVASHGHYDELALEQALRSSAAYVALVASRSRAAAVLEYLAAQNVSEPELARLKYPAGLDIHAVRGDEIALSIMAEVVQMRRSIESIDLEPLLVQSKPPLESTAIDPVCGMNVQVKGALYTYEHEGQAYYFCCAGCKASFARDPEQFLAQPAPDGEAIDPVCGMTVDIASAKHMSDFDGQLYYFCAAGCKASFDKNPLDYALPAATDHSAEQTTS